MIYIETIMCIALVGLCYLSSRSDLREGLIYNKVLVPFAIFGIIIDVIYYGFFVRDIVIDFSLNFILILVINLILFFTHSFAGGDCKLAIVIALIYPARMYLIYGNNDLTLLFIEGIAIFYGYVYMLVSAIGGLVKKRNNMSLNYVKDYIKAFVKSFVTATVYISAVNLIIIAVALKGVEINVWIVRAICMMTAWLVGKHDLLKKYYIIGIVLVFDIIVAGVLKIIPISLNPENYILVVLLLICQMTIKSNLYEEIEVENLKRGMILSTFSTVLMQGSRIRGLPKVSTEDLRDRITQDEVESIQRWAENKKIERIAIVKKVPFAIFLFFGALTYWLIWRVL